VTALQLDPIRCTGHQVCAELLPERVGLDEWGYPVLASGDLPDHLLQQARQAAATCPTRALRLAEPPG
jgi:ferredoxin